jgi:hypothetical protein
MSYHTNRSYSSPPTQRAAADIPEPPDSKRDQYYPGLHPYNNPNVGGPGGTIGEALPHTNNGVTVGFSIRSNVWRSRYSFVPTCYSTLDNIMLSHMKPNNPGNATPGNIHVGRGSEEPDQQSSGFEFERKEGAFYSDIPASTTVEDFSREMMFVGFVRVEDFYADETNVESINDGMAHLWTLPLVNIPQVSLPTSTDTALYFGRRLVAQSELDALAEDPDYMITTGSLQFESIQRIIPITNPAHATPVGYDGHESNRLQPMSYNSETNSIEIFAGIDESIALEEGVPLGKGLQYFVDYFLNIGLFDGTIVPVPEEYIPIYVSQPVSKTGEMMRGHYVGANISGSGEIFAINVDFENTKLDGSLG